MITVGITGGIGSGKTTVAKIWENLGARVIYADNLAKEMMRSDQELKHRIVQTFGDKTYTNDGELNKAHLINEAFKNDRVGELNAIVHPAIREKIKLLILSAEEEGIDFFAYEAAILLNDGRPNYLDKVVLVTSDQNKRIKRVLKRDFVNEKDVTIRMAKQPDFKSLSHLADFIIENNGTLEELTYKAEDLYRKLIGNH